ncbi:LysM domain-protein [Rhypophila decipiens]|uniref:LysM domain-protein n=1 Tax=Rhypophila decipiens TaxID=261697 RepID=A0AAN6Y0E1_9PEZI|nr:LysM domain-protein [Rhypophila decipiens]
MDASSQAGGPLSELPEGIDVVPDFIRPILNLPDTGPPYRSWKDLQTDNVRVSFSPVIERLFWPLQRDFPADISVMKSRHGADDDLERFFEGTKWHEIADLPVSEPKVSSMTEKIYELDQWEFGWVEWHREHSEAAEYVTYGELDDDIRPYANEPDEDGDWEKDSDTEFLIRCCGTDRPVRKRGQRIVITPSVGKDFVTVRDYVSAVHTWLMSLRDDLLLSKTVARPVPYGRPEVFEWMVDRGMGHLRLEEKRDWVAARSPPSAADLPQIKRMQARRAEESR